MAYCEHVCEPSTACVLGEALFEHNAWSLVHYYGDEYLLHVVHDSSADQLIMIFTYVRQVPLRGLHRRNKPRNGHVMC